MSDDYFSQYFLYTNENDDLFVGVDQPPTTYKEMEVFYALSPDIPAFPNKTCILSLLVNEEYKVLDIQICYDPYTLPVDNRINLVPFTRPVFSSFPIYFYKNRVTRKLKIDTKINQNTESINMIPFPIYVFKNRVDEWVCKDGLCHPINGLEKGGDLMTCARNCINQDQYSEVIGKRYNRYIFLIMLILILICLFCIF